MIVDLKKRKDLNGTIAMKLDAPSVSAGRVGVRTNQGEFVGLKPENVRPADAFFALADAAGEAHKKWMFSPLDGNGEERRDMTMWDTMLLIVRGLNVMNLIASFDMSSCNATCQLNERMAELSRRLLNELDCDEKEAADVEPNKYGDYVTDVIVKLKEVRGGTLPSLLELIKVLLAVNVPPTGLIGRVRTGKSKVHGIGLFAARDVERGELLTMYRVGLLRLSKAADYDDGALVSSHRQVNDLAALETRVLNMRSVKERAAASVKYGVDTTWAVPLGAMREDVTCRGLPFMIAGHSEPDRLGHYANSAVASNDANLITKAILDGRINVAFAPMLGGAVLGVFATRDIEAGEELLTNYGPDYDWYA